MDLGTYIEHGGRPAVRFERTYPCEIERLWSAVTEPDELIHWFPSRAVIDLHVGGTVTFSGDPHTDDLTGTVLTCDPPRRLAFTWGDDEIHFQLEAVGDGRCRLALIDVLGGRDTAARNAAGWSICLGELDRYLAGERTGGPHGAGAEAMWPASYEAHVAAGLPSGAAIPS